MFIPFAPYLGLAAGLATSLLWTATSLLFTAAARRIGPTVVNASRLLLAVVLHALTHLLLFATLIPNATPTQVLLLALSGIVGLTIGDQALLIAFVDIGPRLAMLVMTTSPLFAALFGWVVLGETLHATAWLGIALTIGGVSWVVLERPQVDTRRTMPRWLRGMVLALLAAACQAGGLLLSKQGMGHGFLPDDQHLAPQAATLIRVFFAGLGMVPILALHVRRERKRRALLVELDRPEDRTHIGSRRAGLIFCGLGTIVGPYLGVWMSLVAADRAPLGIAQTLCSLSPIFLLPFAALLYGERIGPRAVAGALMAVAGSTLMFIQL